jgi:hypothetical protein
MTRVTLAERLQAYERRSLWLLAVGSLVMVLTFVAVFVLWSRLVAPGSEETDGLEERQLRARTWSWVWLAFAGLGVVVRLVVFWGQLRTARKFGLACPSCGALLVRTRYWYVALGTGKCDRCQAQVVEVPGSLSGPLLPTRDEFLARLGEYKAAYRREGKWHVPAALLCLLSGGLAVPVGVFVEPLLRPAGLSGLAVLLFFVLLVSPALVCLYCVRRWESRLRRSHGVVCRWCGGGFTGANGKSAEATGRCGACGQPAWSDAAELAPQPTGPA